MWIRQLPKNYKELPSFYNKVVFLWKSNELPIYISDNHLTAAWCWMQECEAGELYNFMHIDRHSDLKACGYPQAIEHLKSNTKLSFDDYLDITYDNGRTYHFFQWDNYIRACHYIFPEWFNTNYFYVHEAIYADETPWGYNAFSFNKRNSMCVREDISQFIEEISEYMGDGPKGDMWNKPWIVNLDLDFFWDGNKIKIFDNQFIRDFARRLMKSLNNIKVLTIALSPECVGGESLEQKWNSSLNVLNIFREELNLSVSFN